MDPRLAVRLGFALAREGLDEAEGGLPWDGMSGIPSDRRTGRPWARLERRKTPRHGDAEKERSPCLPSPFPASSLFAFPLSPLHVWVPACLRAEFCPANPVFDLRKAMALQELDQSGCFRDAHEGRKEGPVGGFVSQRPWNRVQGMGNRARTPIPCSPFPVPQSPPGWLCFAGRQGTGREIRAHGWATRGQRRGASGGTSARPGRW